LNFFYHEFQQQNTLHRSYCIRIYENNFFKEENCPINPVEIYALTGKNREL